jgi:hypothetical protein
MKNKFAKQWKEKLEKNRNDFWGEIIEDRNNRIIKRKALIDGLTGWGLVLCVVGLLLVIFVR